MRKINVSVAPLAGPYIIQYETDYQHHFAVHEDREKVLLDYERQMRGDDQGIYRSYCIGA
jgi:hypothetical protein